MEIVGIILAVTLSICFLIIVIALIFGRSNNKRRNYTKKSIPDLESEISDAQKWINIVKKMFDDNIAMDFLNIYVECGMSKEIAFSKNNELINSNMPFKKGTKECDRFQTYQWAISERYSLHNRKLPTCAMNPNEYGLNIPENETILDIIYDVILHEEKTVRNDIIYSGIRWSNGLLRSGSISAIGNEIKNFVPVDAGKLAITNKRLIFVGSQKHITKAVKISDILVYQIYKEGLLLRQTNKKPLLLQFYFRVDFEIFQIQDGLNKSIILIDRIINGNYNQNLDEKEKFHSEEIIEHSNYTLEQSKKTVEDVRKMVDGIRNQVEDFKIQAAANDAIPLCNYHLDELKKLNITLETTKEFMILENCKSNMFVHLEWFIEEEKEYPNAPWNMVGGALNMIEKIKNRYNERIYLIVKEAFEYYQSILSNKIAEHDKDWETESIFTQIQEAQGYADKQAANYQECSDDLTDFYNKVEDLFSNT